MEQFEQDIRDCLHSGQFSKAYGMMTGRPEWGDRMEELVPAHMHQGIALYMIMGIEPGGFMQCVISNDLMGALHHADHINIDLLPKYGEFLHNYAPANSYGSHDALRVWIKMGGILGSMKKAEEENQ